mmetsp:Transcript_17346/g.29328  ORF Transcript_17346/g.29328 Transcript_17346/m.29328 type:complete len:206 (+) Transcript_17346:67-684(+)
MRLHFLLFSFILVGLAAAETFCNNGEPTAVGDMISVHYSGYIHDLSATGVKGKMFDSSVKRKQAFNFKLGAGQVIRGWDEGLVGLCLGERKTLIVPPELGYGSRGAGKDIPPNATLRFVVDVVAVNDNVLHLEPEEDPNVFKEMDANRDLMISYDEMAQWFRTMHPDKLERIPDGLFEREDKNGDQMISWEEFDGPKGDSMEGEF